jgi:hypothetical protein
VRNWRCIGIGAAFAVGACDVQRGPPNGGNGPSNLPGASRGLDAPHAIAIDDSVRTFAAEVARGITQGGSAAWREYFMTGPAFFMASEGRLVFANGGAATKGIDALTHVITHIELRWGDAVRVDVLGPGLAMLAASYDEVRVDSAQHRTEEIGFFTGLAEHRAEGWRFRDAHWSVLNPAAHAP